MRAFVSGGAGFIGSHLVARLLREGHEVTAHDNLSLGRREFLRACEGEPGFRFVRGDLLDPDPLESLLRGQDAVFHLAANSDIAAGTARTDVDLRAGTLATFNLLEGMRRAGVGRLVFASTSAVYGEAGTHPCTEDHGPLRPISLYGASKLACEGLISAWSHQFALRAHVYRFANVVGPHGTHGVVVDFLRKLAGDPTSLEVLGDGSQAKPYLHVDDCVEGMLVGFERASGALCCLNLTTRGATSVRRIVSIVCEELGLGEVRVRYGSEPRGWRGDVPQVRMDPGRIERLGWRARLGSDEAVRAGVRALRLEIGGA